MNWWCNIKTRTSTTHIHLTEKVNKDPALSKQKRKMYATTICCTSSAWMNVAEDGNTFDSRRNSIAPSCNAARPANNKMIEHNTHRGCRMMHSSSGLIATRIIGFCHGKSYMPPLHLYCSTSKHRDGKREKPQNIHKSVWDELKKKHFTSTTTHSVVLVTQVFWSYRQQCGMFVGGGGGY